jgi:rare lipoprotein A
MRLPNSQKLPLLALVVSLCGLGTMPAYAGDSPAPPNGPAADYPVMIGESYQIGAVSFTPSNAMNYDAVGLASVGQDGAEGVSAAHHTLPIPSYVEITALDSGKTILVRVDRRGPMTSANVIEISAAAAGQLGLHAGGSAGVRVRRVNPPEIERAALRSGGTAPERIPTPKSLLAVLARKLNPEVPVLLARSAPPAVEMGAPMVTSGQKAGKYVATPMKLAKLQTVVPSKGPAAVVTSAPPMMTGASYVKPAGSGFANAFGTMNTSPSRVAPKATANLAPVAVTASRSGNLVIQAAAFSVKSNAEASAAKLGANVQSAGNMWRVRVGPFESRETAEAALAKVKAAGYSGARIQRNG